MDNYFNRPEVSNSDLSYIEKYWLPMQRYVDIEKAYRFGTLVDAIITEPEKVDYYQYTVAGIQYTAEEFELAEKMKKAFRADAFCSQFAQKCTYQKISIKPNFLISFMGLVFSFAVRCKWDLFAEMFDMAGDIKSTACETQASFEASIEYFNYDRQAAWYMDIEGRENFIIIGISKKNFKIFKVPIKRGDATYNRGKAKYEELAFKYWYLFS